jgi:two-component system, NarL family, sensor histidine kinase DesK
VSDDQVYVADDDPEDDYARSRGDLAPRLARIVVTVVFSGLCLVALLNILSETTSGPGVLLAAAAMGSLLALQLFFLSQRARHASARIRLLLLAAQLLLAFLPFLEFGQAWVSLPGFAAGSVALMLPPPYSIGVFALVVAGNGAIQAAIEPRGVTIAYTTVSTLLTGLIVYGLSRMSLLVRELHQTRAEMARLAVSHERTRFARDLHDLLGYSLSAVVLKSELARRLVDRNPDRALTELEEIGDISRRALADVRIVARGYRQLSLPDEALSARSVLTAADVSVQMDVDCGQLPDEVSTVLATVLREGVTNLLRHSKAECCEIRVRRHDERVCLLMANDGAPERPDADSGTAGGSGIGNLAVRAVALGGSLSSERTADGWFRLRAELPLAVPADPVATSSPPPGRS